MKSNHTHKYHIGFIGKSGQHMVYNCLIEGCTHYIHAFNAPETLKTLCDGCNKEMIIASDSLQQKVGKGYYYPSCKECVNSLPQSNVNSPNVKEKA